MNNLNELFNSFKFMENSWNSYSMEEVNNLNETGPGSCIILPVTCQVLLCKLFHFFGFS